MSKSRGTLHNLVCDVSSFLYAVVILPRWLTEVAPARRVGSSNGGICGQKCWSLWRRSAAF